MYELLEKLDYIINSNGTDYNKIENIIKSNILYVNLDMDEQSLILETLQDKINEKIKQETKEIKQETKEIKQETKEIKSESQDNDFKPLYPFKKKGTYIPSNPIMVKGNDGKLVSEGAFMSSITKAVILDEISETEYFRRKSIFDKLAAIILPAQRSPEWYAARNLRVTGSDAGCVLNMNKHEPQFNFILKKVLGSTFDGNAACYHGKKFEQVVTMMYELENDVSTVEFGLLPHESINILAASPDGICSPYKRDGKTPSSLVGRMLEIKCPTMRKIKYSGDIKDTICPVYYWCQIQQQMECCNLDECDFVQCNIEEYSSRKEWLLDTSDECDYKSKKYGLERGVIIELIPFKLGEDDYKLYQGKTYLADLTLWNKTTFLYPPKIDMSIKELDDWVLEQLENLDNTVKVNRVIYWRLVEKNCTLILRDKKWFDSQMPIYEKIWGYVTFLRNNLDVIEEWKKWIDLQPRKYNDKIMQKLDELIENKNNPDKKIVKKNSNIFINIDDYNEKPKEENNIDNLKNENKEEIAIACDDKPKRKYVRKNKVKDEQ
jgi:putative phage-type endonuclease